MAETLPTVSLGDINPGLLYAEYVQEWLNRDDWRTQMNHDMREAFACELAWYFHSNAINSVHYAKLPAMIGEHFPVAGVKELEYFDNDVRTCNFLIRDPNGEYMFAHKSFMEFFIGLKLYREIVKGKYASFGVSLTPEVVQFLSDLLSGHRVGTSDIVESLARQDNPTVKGNLAILLCKLGSDLRDVSLAGANLCGVELARVTLADCDLRNANLSGSNFSQADFSSSRLDGADLSFSRFNGERFDYADLSQTLCRGGEFMEASMKHAKAERCIWDNVDLTDADLDGANFVESKLKKVRLCGTLMRGATMDKAYLDGGSFTDAQLENASFVSTEFREVRMTLSDASGVTKACFARSRFVDVSYGNETLEACLKDCATRRCLPGTHDDKECTRHERKESNQA